MQVIAPTEATICSNNDQPDIIDFAIIKNINSNYDCTTIEELDSDHYPILINLANSNVTTTPKIIKTTNWPLFKENFPTTKINIHNTRDTKTSILKFEDNIRQTIKKFSTEKTVKKFSPQPSKEIIDAINAKRRIKKLYQKTLFLDHKSKLNKVNKKLKQLLHEENNRI